MSEIPAGLVGCGGLAKMYGVTRPTLAKYVRMGIFPPPSAVAMPSRALVWNTAGLPTREEFEARRPRRGWMIGRRRTSSCPVWIEAEALVALYVITASDVEELVSSEVLPPPTKHATNASGHVLSVWDFKTLPLHSVIEAALARIARHAA